MLIRVLSFAVVSWGLLAGEAWGQAATSGLIQRGGIAVSAAGKVYVVDTAHDSVSVVDAKGHAQRVKVGPRPLAIAVNNRSGEVYVYIF